MSVPPRDRPAPELQRFDTDECLRHLADGGIGRLAVPGPGAPELRPVNFLLHDGRIVIRTGEGEILAAAREGEPASFEIDGIDPMEHTGWSVIVAGVLEELPSDDEHLDLPLRPWASGQKDRFVGLSLERVSGLGIPPGRGNR